MGKFVVLGVAFALFGLLRLSTADLEHAQIPFLSAAQASSGLAASAQVMGTPAAVALPAADPASWFAAAVAEASSDPTDPAKWAAVRQFAAAASTVGGWAEACKKAGASAGTDRKAKPELGALACSEDPTVTTLQRFALQLLAAEADVALWLHGVSGSDDGGVAGRLAEIRHSCENELPSRLAGPESPYTAACAAVLAKTTLPGDANGLFTALGEGFALVAGDLAARDATIDPEPAKVADGTGTATPGAS
jgi:hypothetical protein